MTRRTSGL